MTNLPLVKQPTAKPTRKVTASTLGAAVGAAAARIAVNVIEAHLPILSGAEVTALLFLTLPPACAFALGWLVRDRAAS